MTDAGLSFNPKSTALLLMDFQNEIVSEGGKMAPEDKDALARIDAAIAAASRAVTAARRAGVPVYHVIHGRPDGEDMHLNPDARVVKFVLESDALREGTWGADIHAALTPKDGDEVVVKHGISALVETGLDDRLRRDDIDTVLLAGVVTHWAVEGTARTAFDLGYRFVVLADACASGVPASHEGALERLQFIGDIADVAAVEGALAG